MNTKNRFILPSLLLGILVLLIFLSSKPAFIREVKKIDYSVENVRQDMESAVYEKWGKVGASFSLSLPVYIQKYSLSCEIASLRMALAFKGVVLPEDTLIQDLPFETLDPPVRDPVTQKLIWGDPNKGFVGKINGQMPKTGYGVYEKPILDVALKYREAKILDNPSIQTLIPEILNENPIVVWGSITKGRDISWQDESGNKILAVEGEHARVVVGFRGNPDDPSHILIVDPIYGKIQMTTSDFERDWALLGNKAVVIY